MFVFDHCGGIARLLNDNHNPAASVLSSNDMDVSRRNLESKELDLLVEELDFDVQSYKVYESKLQNHHVTVQHQRDAWANKRYAKAKGAVSEWLQTNVHEAAMNSWV